MAKADLFSTTTAVPISLPPEERSRIEAEIQQHLGEVDLLVARLDASDADPDIEDNGDAEPDVDGEADLGWPEILNQSKAIHACAGWEAANDLEQDGADDEPSLGSPLAAMHDQTRWTVGDASDLEDQCEDEGADEGAECFSSLSRYIPPTKGDVRAAKAASGFIRRVKRNGKLGRAVPVPAICVPAREESR